MTFFKTLFSGLNGKSIKYMVIGGIAVNLYGIERATSDIDIVMVLDDKNISKFIEIAKELDLRPKIPVKLEDFASEKMRNEWAAEKGMKVFSLYDSKAPFILLDVLIDIPFRFDEAYKRRTVMEYEGIEIPVIAIPDLIAMKKKTGRPQDNADVYHLRKIVREWENA